MIATSTAKVVSLNNPFPSTIVSDAFEAVTNGMNNPEALEQLEKQRGNANTAEWIYLIQAIQQFYSNDFSNMNQMLSQISEDSKAASLKRVLFDMSGLQKNSVKLTYHEGKLSKRVTENSRFLTSAIEELKESLNYSEDLFAETASLLIKEVKHKTPLAAERLALWSFRMCADHDFNDEALANNILMLFGQAEGLRLIGLSLIETEPESALICFTRSLIRRIVDKTAAKNESIGYLEIIEALITECSDDDPVIMDITELLTMLEDELNLFFNLGLETSNSRPAAKIAEIKRKLIGDTNDEEKPVIIKKKAMPPAKEAVQLELF